MRKKVGFPLLQINCNEAIVQATPTVLLNEGRNIAGEMDLLSQLYS